MTQYITVCSVCSVCLILSDGSKQQVLSSIFFCLYAVEAQGARISPPTAIGRQREGLSYPMVRFLSSTFDERILQYCSGQGFVAMAEDLCRQHQRGAISDWEDGVTLGMVDIPSCLFNTEHITTDKINRALLHALSWMIDISHPDDVITLRGSLQTHGEKEMQNLVKYTLYRCRLRLHHTFADRITEIERLRSFEDLVILMLVDDIHVRRLALEARFRSPTGGPLRKSPGFASMRKRSRDEDNASAVRPDETSASSDARSARVPLLPSEIPMPMVQSEYTEAVCQHCLRQGFVHLAQTFYQQYRRGELSTWDEDKGKGRLTIPPVLARRTFERSYKSLAPTGDAVALDRSFNNRMVNFCLRQLLKRAGPFAYPDLKHYLTCLNAEETADIVKYTFYRCRPSALDAGHASFRNEERCLSFEDVVIVMYAASVNDLKEHFQRRSRSLIGGPQL